MSTALTTLARLREAVLEPSPDLAAIVAGVDPQRALASEAPLTSEDLPVDRPLTDEEAAALLPFVDVLQVLSNASSTGTLGLYRGLQAALDPGMLWQIVKEDSDPTENRLRVPPAPAHAGSACYRALRLRRALHAAPAPGPPTDAEARRAAECIHRMLESPEVLFFNRLSMEAVRSFAPRMRRLRYPRFAVAAAEHLDAVLTDQAAYDAHAGGLDLLRLARDGLTGEVDFEASLRALSEARRASAYTEENVTAARRAMAEEAQLRRLLPLFDRAFRPELDLAARAAAAAAAAARNGEGMEEEEEEADRPRKMPRGS